MREQGIGVDRAGRPGPDVVIVAGPHLPPLPAAVEVAAYRIATEAITNAIRHADARQCRVRITVNTALGAHVSSGAAGTLVAQASPDRTRPIYHHFPHLAPASAIELEVLHSAASSGKPILSRHSMPITATYDPFEVGWPAASPGCESNLGCRGAAPTGSGKPLAVGTADPTWLAGGARHEVGLRDGSNLTVHKQHWKSDPGVASNTTARYSPPRTCRNGGEGEGVRPRDWTGPLVVREG
jgi:hypothetical protein